MFNQQSYNQKVNRISKRRVDFFKLNKAFRELSRTQQKQAAQIKYQALVIEDLNERLNELEEAARVGILAKTVAKVRSVFK